MTNILYELNEKLKSSFKNIKSIEYIKNKYIITNIDGSVLEENLDEKEINIINFVESLQTLGFPLIRIGNKIIFTTESEVKEILNKYDNPWDYMKDHKKLEIPEFKYIQSWNVMCNFVDDHDRFILPIIKSKNLLDLYKNDFETLNKMILEEIEAFKLLKEKYKELNLKYRYSQDYSGRIEFLEYSINNLHFSNKEFLEDFQKFISKEPFFGIIDNYTEEI